MSTSTPSTRTDTGAETYCDTVSTTWVSNSPASSARAFTRRGVTASSSAETKALVFTNGAETSSAVVATNTGGAVCVFVFFTAMVCVRRPAVTPGVASTTRSAASVSSASV